MKLAFVIKTLSGAGGGAERVLAQLTSELAQRGHDVTIVSFGSPEEPDFYPVDNRVERIWLEIGNVHARSSPWDVLRRILALRRTIRTLGPEIAIGFMHSAYVPLALALAASAIPVIASEHILYSHYRAFPTEALSLRMTAGLYCRMTVISEEIRKSYPRKLAERTDVIPNPVIPANVGTSPKTGRSRVLLNVGRLFDQKDQRTLIEAFGLVAGAYPSWRLRIVGEGPLRATLEQLVKRLGLEERVQLPGTTTDIEREYRQADLFAMPSRYESFGLATAEALAHGVPAVGFADCPGTNDLIQNNVNGILVQSGDRVTALAAVLGHLMGDVTLRARYSRAAPRSLARFSLDRIVSQWEDLLRQCIAKKGVDN